MSTKTILCSSCAKRDEDGKIIEKGRHATAAEARACKGAPDPVQTKVMRDFIRASGLLSDHLTKSGLQHVAGVMGLETHGTKTDLAARIREVL